MTILLIKEWNYLVFLICQMLQLGHKQAAVASKKVKSGKSHPQRKRLLMFLQKETGSTCITLSNCTPLQQLQAEVEAYETSRNR